MGRLGIFRKEGSSIYTFLNWAERWRLQSLSNFIITLEKEAHSEPSDQGKHVTPPIALELEKAWVVKDFRSTRCGVSDVCRKRPKSTFHETITIRQKKRLKQDWRE